MKKVLLISNKVFHYRVSNYNYFAQRFEEEGWQLIIRSNQMQKNNPYELRFDFAELPFSFKGYKREIERIQPDVVILFLHLKDLLIWPLIHWLRRREIPVVYWNKGVNLEVRNPWLRNVPFYCIHSWVNGIILYSKHEINDIKPKNRHKVFVANNTVNFTAFPEIKASPAVLKEELGIPFKKVVLFVGRMRPVKKVEHLIEAFSTIDHPDYGCVLVGDKMDYDLDRLIHSENVLHLGEVFDPSDVRISKIFKMADIFAIPGDVGLGMNQAFFWGLPVVTEAGRQPPEIHYLVPGSNGFIVPENDVAELRRQILVLLEDDELRASFSRNAKEHIEREASIEQMFRGFLDCVTAIVPRREACAKDCPAT